MYWFWMLGCGLTDLDGFREYKLLAALSPELITPDLCTWQFPRQVGDSSDTHTTSVISP